MKNKNFLYMGLLIGFIFLYSEFVVKPYNEKYKAAPATQTQGVTPNPQTSANQAPPVNSVAPTTPVQADAAGIYLNESDKKAANTISLNSKRSVSIFSNGAIGAATLAEFNVRMTKIPTPVVLMSEGLKWSSNDPQVEQCLTQLKDSGNHLFFSSAVSPVASQPYCTLTYAPHPEKTGLISVKLGLYGFQNSKGVVELRGVDRLGLDDAQNQPFLMSYLNESKKDLRGKKIFESSEIPQGKLSWIMWGDRYFGTALLPRGNFNPNFIHGYADPSRPFNEKENPPLYFGFQYPIVNQENLTFDLDILFTPRDSVFMATIQPDLEKAMDLGLFPAVARALIFALKSIHRVVGNYGIAIIVLTLIARLAFWPLNKKVFQSGQKMKALQPHMERIKAKYGNDRAKSSEMNLEVMGLYKKHGVNPMGSCLPMLLQLPIWFGLYQALSNSLDLYQAPFYGWITDLSAPDRFFVFPVLWSISLIVYIFVNPQPQQPGQPDMRWMMFAMNIFIGYMSRLWPSGLTIYLFVSNLVGITQQLLMQRAGKKLQPIQEGV